MGRYEFKQEDLIGLVGYLHAETRTKGDEVQFKECPYCHASDKWTFSVNMVNGCFNCLRATCGVKGAFVELCRDMDYELSIGEENAFKALKQPPTGHLIVMDGAIAYLKNRGISEAITRLYECTVSTNRPNVLVFPFYNEYGKLEFLKYRNMMYKKGDKGSKEWCEADTKPILFGIKQCSDFERLIITEGQIDSLSVAEAGFKNAVSVPMGCNNFNWLKHNWEWITKFKEVVVFGDWEKGRMTLLDELRARLPMKVLAVRHQDYLGEKDANDILRSFGVDAIRKAVNNAEPYMLTNIKDLSDVDDVDIANLPKIKTGIYALDAATGGLGFGQVMLLTGRRGEGKSTLMSQIGANALDDGFNVLFYSAELPSYRFKAWLNNQLAGKEYIEAIETDTGKVEYSVMPEARKAINQWYKGRAFIYDDESLDDDENHETLLQTIEKAIKQYGVSLVCIDNLMTAMDSVRDHNDLYLAQSNFVGGVKKLAKKYDISVILVAHVRKASAGVRDFDNDEVSGSADVTNKVDVVINYKKEDESSGANGSISITKNRFGGEIITGNNRIMMMYSPETKRVIEMNNRGVREYSWTKLLKRNEDEANGMIPVDDIDVPF